MVLVWRWLWRSTELRLLKIGLELYLRARVIAALIKAQGLLLGSWGFGGFACRDDVSVIERGFRSRHGR